MSDLSRYSDEELIAELSRRRAMPGCPCGRWKTFVGIWDRDGHTLRCHGCMLAVGKCRC